MGETLDVEIKGGPGFELNAIACLIQDPIGVVRYGGLNYSRNDNMKLEPRVFVYVEPESLSIGNELNIRGIVLGQLTERPDRTITTEQSPILSAGSVSNYVSKIFTQPMKESGIIAYTLVNLPMEDGKVPMVKIIFFSRQDPALFLHDPSISQPTPQRFSHQPSL